MDQKPVTGGEWERMAYLCVVQAVQEKPKQSFWRDIWSLCRRSAALPDDGTEWYAWLEVARLARRQKDPLVLEEPQYAQHEPRCMVSDLTYTYRTREGADGRREVFVPEESATGFGPAMVAPQCARCRQWVHEEGIGFHLDEHGKLALTEGVGSQHESRSLVFHPGCAVLWLVDTIQKGVW